MLALATRSSLRRVFNLSKSEGRRLDTVAHQNFSHFEVNDFSMTLVSKSIFCLLRSRWISSTRAVGPDVGIKSYPNLYKSGPNRHKSCSNLYKSCPNLYKSDPKSRNSSYFLKSDVSQNSPNSHIIFWVTFVWKFIDNCRKLLNLVTVTAAGTSEDTSSCFFTLNRCVSSLCSNRVHLPRLLKTLYSYLGR